MGIAQIIYVACGIASLSWGFSKHGKLDKPTPPYGIAISTALFLALLLAGGFFDSAPAGVQVVLFILIAAEGVREGRERKINAVEVVGSNFIHLTLAWWGGFFG